MAAQRGRVSRSFGQAAHGAWGLSGAWQGEGRADVTEVKARTSSTIGASSWPVRIQDKTKSRATCGHFSAALGRSPASRGAGEEQNLAGELDEDRTGDSLYDVTEDFACDTAHVKRTTPESEWNGENTWQWPPPQH